MKNGRLVLIGVENFNREYSGKKKLAENLVSLGYVVFLSHKSLIRSIVKLLPISGQIYIDKGVRPNSLNRYKTAKKKGLNVFSFDEEALMHDDFDYFLKNNHEPEVIKYIDGIFCWGDNHKKMLEAAGYSNKQIIKSGNPRFDKCKNLQLQSNLKKNSKYIMLCSRFGIANPNKKLKSEVYSEFRDYLKETKELLKFFIKIPKLIREAGIETPILIRPHPSESQKLWVQSTRDLLDIQISNNGPVLEAFKSASLMIHNRCTTAIEAYIAGIPVISYEPVDYSGNGHPPSEFIDSFSNVVSYDEIQLIDNIKKCSSNALTTTNLKDSHTASNYLYYIDKPCSEKIANFIFKQLPPKSKTLNYFQIIRIIFLALFLRTYHNLHKLRLFIFDFVEYKYQSQKNGKINDKELYENNSNFLSLKISSISKLFIPKV